MAVQTRSRQLQPKQGKIVAMMLIGAGLLVLGVLALMLLPKPQATAVSAGGPSAVPVPVNFAAPELNLTDLNEEPVSLADYRGSVVLVNNWATWCPPCKAEMPTLQAFFEDYRSEGFAIVAIEAGDPVSDIVEFVADYGLTFPVWPDATMKSIAAFRNQGLPSSYVIDRNGTVRLAWVGAISREMLEKHVVPLLEE